VQLLPCRIYHSHLLSLWIQDTLRTCSHLQTLHLTCLTLYGSLSASQRIPDRVLQEPPEARIGLRARSAARIRGGMYLTEYNGAHTMTRDAEAHQESWQSCGTNNERALHERGSSSARDMAS
jgi:hypothetical protein